MSDQENSAGSWWGDMADAFKESVKSLINSGTQRINREIVGQGDVSDYPAGSLRMIITMMSILIHTNVIK